MLIIGTPVEGSNPAKPTAAFIEKMTKVEGNKANPVYHLQGFWQRANDEKNGKKLEPKGYKTIAKVSVKGMKPEKEADFSKFLDEVKKALEKQ